MPVTTAQTPRSVPAAGSPALIGRDLATLWHPCSQMRDYRTFEPLHVVGAEGCRLHLADGRVVLDAISSWWCKTLGHGHPRLRAALQRQAARFEHVILANTTSEPIVRLAERLLSMANGDDAMHWGPGAPAGRRAGHFGKAFFADNGSTAVEVAMKMAIQAHAQCGRPQRTRFASLQNGYHGETIATLSVGDCGLYSKPYEALMFDTVKLTGLAYRSGVDDPAWGDASAQWPAIERQLDAVARDLAAVVYEPILQAAGGMRIYSPDLLRRLRDWADAHEVYLIADEIAAGMGRCGEMLAHFTGARCQVPGAAGAQKGECDNGGRIALPDFVVLSKGLTAGVVPMSVVLTTDGIYDVFDADYTDLRAFLHSNTYTGNALAVAVANEVLDVFVDERVLEHVAAVGPALLQGLGELQGTRPYLHHVRGIGMVAAVDIRQRDGSPLDWKKRTGYRVFQHATERGALLRPLGDTMYLFPPLNTSRADITAMISVLADALDHVMG